MMLIETAIAEDLAAAFKENRPQIPESTEQVPQIQEWRQWCADVTAIARVMYETREDIRAFQQRAGMPA